jgi:hypothetical protein
MYQTAYTGILKNKFIIMVFISTMLMSVAAANYILPGSHNIVSTGIVFQDPNNHQAGMTLNPLTHEFIIHNPSGTVSTGTYKELDDRYVVIYDGGLSQNVPKWEGGVLGPNGEKWIRS